MRKSIWLPVMLSLLGWATRLDAQTASQPPSAIGGLRLQLPVVPSKEPRPAQGPAADQQWQTGRTGAEAAPLASFIDTLQANDAAFEVILGQGRLLTTKVDIAGAKGTAVIAVGDPTVIDFQVLPNPRMIRVTGRRAGVTDFSITTADGQVYSFEVHVVYDLDLLRAQLKQIFPDAHLRLAQLREHVIVEGQARSPAQVARIIQTIESYLESAQVRAPGNGGQPVGRPSARPGQTGGTSAERPAPRESAKTGQAQQAQAVTQAGPEAGGAAGGEAPAKPRVINLIRVVYDLDSLRAQLKQIFPDAHVRLAQLRKHVIVEGEARSPEQVTQIIRTIESYLESIGSPAASEGASTGQAQQPQPVTQAGPEAGGAAGAGAPAKPRVINLIRVPGVHQVMLQVRIAELNRTGLRQIGADIIGVQPTSNNIFGTSLAGATINALATIGLGGLIGAGDTANGPATTAFGIIPGADFEILFRALRRNSLLNILAEPNLMALSGQDASFLAGGEFPVPVPQSGVATGAVTIEWKKFGVQLTFTPYVMEDESIRLHVEPEVSSIDRSLGVVVQNLAVPGVNSRNAKTTVQLRQGDTLAIAGLLSVTLDAQTSRIPGLGDLPYIGPLFSNTSHQREEKELLVLVTPYLVRPMCPDQVPPLPGEEVQDPNDLEFYLLNRIEGRTGGNYRSTTSWDDPLGLVHLLKLERRHVCGPVGLSQ